MSSFCLGLAAFADERSGRLLGFVAGAQWLHDAKRPGKPRTAEDSYCLSTHWKEVRHTREGLMHENGARSRDGHSPQQRLTGIRRLPRFVRAVGGAGCSFLSFVSALRVRVRV